MSFSAIQNRIALAALLAIQTQKKMSFSAIQNRIALAALLAIQSLTPAAHALELKRLTSGIEVATVGAMAGGSVVLGATKALAARARQQIHARKMKNAGWISFGANLKATDERKMKIGSGCAGGIGSPSGDGAVVAMAALTAASGYLAGERLFRGKTQFLLNKDTMEVQLNKKFNKFGKSEAQKDAFPKEYDQKTGDRKLPLLENKPSFSAQDGSTSYRLLDRTTQEPTGWSLQIKGSKERGITEWLQRKQQASAAADVIRSCDVFPADVIPADLVNRTLEQLTASGPARA